MKKIILWGGVGLLIVAATAASVVWSMRPQVITLKNGTKLTLVGVSYGKHHAFRGLKTLGSSRQRGRASIDTTNDTLVVWIKAETKSHQRLNQWPNFQLFVYDSDNTACVSAWQSANTQIKNGVYVDGFTLNAYPRRSAKIILRVSAWNNGGGMQEFPKGEMTIANPGPRSYPDWAPDAVPDEQSDGDLNVTLTHFDPAARGFMYGNGMRASKDPREKAVSATFHTEQNGNVVTNWQPIAIVTTDATGNSAPLNSWSNPQNASGDAVMTYQWGLWPIEKAWKLHVEMSRTSGFSSNEEWTVSDLPVKKGDWNQLWNFNMGGQNPNQATQIPYAETTLNGIHLKIYPAISTSQNMGMGQTMGGIHVTADPRLPDGFRMSLVDLTNEKGHKLQTFGFGPNSTGNGNYVYQLPDLNDAKSLNLSIAVHQSRFVEFTVKPTKQ